MLRTAENWTEVSVAVPSLCGADSLLSNWVSWRGVSWCYLQFASGPNAGIDINTSLSELYHSAYHILSFIYNPRYTKLPTLLSRSLPSIRWVRLLLLTLMKSIDSCTSGCNDSTQLDNLPAYADTVSFATVYIPA
jgi:hypothetical protein